MTTSSQLLRELSYYDILGVKTDCSTQEIKAAFVQKSKIIHPDMKNSSEAASSKEFIKLMDAYKVLSKSHSRANYDMHLNGIDRMNFVSNDIYHEPWKSETMHKTTDRSYYGVRGLGRMANWKIVMACVVFCVVGSVIQAYAIKKSFTFKRSAMLERSAKSSEHLHKVKADAKNFTFEEQVERMKSRARPEG